MLAVVDSVIGFGTAGSTCGGAPATVVQRGDLQVSEFLGGDER